VKIPIALRSRRQFFERASELQVLGLIVFLAFLNGLLYLFIVPPWQHFDEPGHFEYVWLITHQGRRPQDGDFDLTMRSQVAGSMVEHGFFRDLGFLPELEPTDGPAWIGIPQLDEPPVYYQLAAMSLRWMDPADILGQLYAARSVSLVLFLITVVAAWGIIRELSPSGSPLRWLFPATVAIFPPLANIMTAVNNDAAAIAAFSLFCWVCIRSIQRGFSWWLFALAAALTLACYWIKNTTLIAAPLFLFALLLSLLRGSRQRQAWIWIGAGCVGGLLASVTWGDAALWYRSTLQSGPAQSSAPAAVHGEHALMLESGVEVSPHWLKPLVQPIPQPTAQQVAGKTVTLGSWIWATEPLETRTPILVDGEQSHSQVIQVSETPAFFAFPVKLPKTTARLWVSLDPRIKGQPAGATIFFDGLLLVEGDRPVEAVPVFASASGDSGEWGGERFENLLRNGSGERQMIRFRSGLDRLASRLFPHYSLPSFMLQYLSDWTGPGWHYRVSFLRLFRTFWGQFGWGHVPLLGHKPYRALAIITLIGLAGALVGLWRRREALPWASLAFMGFAFAGAWGGTLLRGVSHLNAISLYLPVARYAFIAILPTILVLASGWWEILAGIRRRFADVQIPQMVYLSKIVYVVYFALLLGLDGYSLISILYFYR
jgi:hypothetical protein